MKGRGTTVEEAPFCKACRYVERVENENGAAHLRVWPCIWTRKVPAPRKKRLKTPVAAADLNMEVTDGTRSDGPECVCLVGMVLSCRRLSVLRVKKNTAGGGSVTPKSTEREAHGPPLQHSREA